MRIRGAPERKGTRSPGRSKLASLSIGDPGAAIMFRQ